jgi:hypothetical protein
VHFASRAETVVNYLKEHGATAGPTVRWIKNGEHGALRFLPCFCLVLCGLLCPSSQKKSRSASSEFKHGDYTAVEAFTKAVAPLL